MTETTDSADDTDSADRAVRVTDAMRRIVLSRAKDDGLAMIRPNVALFHWGRRIGTHLVDVVPPLIEAGHLVLDPANPSETWVRLHLSDSGKELLREIDARRYS